MFRSSEQRHFSDLVSKHLAEKDAPLLLEGGTGLGKTRAYLAALANREESVAIVLPTHQLIDQLLASTDLTAVGLSVAAFRPSRMFETRAEYSVNREMAIASRVMLCTAASVMIDQRLRGEYNSAINRDYLLFDEADQLPQAAALQKDMTITDGDLRDAGVTLSSTQETIQKLIAKSGIDPEVRARAFMMDEALSDPAWYHKVGLNEDGGIELFHILPGRLLKRIANRGNSAFISATLQIADSFDDFKRSMGIAEISRFSGVIEPEKHGTITIEAPLEEDVLDVITRAQRPCLVAVASHDAAQALGGQMPNAIVRQSTETTSQAAMRVEDDGVLIAAGAWAGLDTPIQWSSIVIPRIPFERPTVLDKKVESRYIDSKNVATRRMRQVIGRGLRSPEARCAIYILDERYTNLGNFIPKRFSKSWIEGGSHDYVLSKAERDPAVRREALKHYGCKCHACGLLPVNPRVIDVHHLDPISEGERKTTMKDVIPLCANCHRLAHTRKPPIPLEELKALVAITS